jgi:hypothetical protein
MTPTVATVQNTTGTMTRDSSEDHSESDTGILTGTCDHCEWQTVANSHAELVQAYQDHLRDEHPTVWLRT